MNIPLIIIAALIFFVANLLNSAPTRQPRTPENRANTLRNKRMHFSSCMSGIHERLQLTKEQLSTIEKFTNELRDMRKVTAESLDKNRNKIHDALSKEKTPRLTQTILANSA